VALASKVRAWLAVCAGALALFAVVALAALSGQRTVAALDADTAEWLARETGPLFKALMGTVSAWHVPRGILALMALAAAGLLWRRDGRGVLLLLAVVPGGATLNHLLKHAIQRPRPGLERVVAAATDFSFPSGHAANAALLYGCLAALLVSHLRSRGPRIAVVFAAVLVVGLVGCSRVVLGAHRLSDVVAGVLLGIAWLSLCVAVAGMLDGDRPRI
jgi:undecaprenyl-diphosphatase